jgi:HTH-type transcriptional regulator/antitoxin MqsA
MVVNKMEQQVARVCPVCGERAMSISRDPIPVEFRDGSYIVEGFEYELCAACGESLHAPGQIDAIHAQAAGLARAERGLLTPEQIRKLRKDLGLTQTQLERVLGVGPKTITRWEKGTVFQSAVADNFMRKIWEHPELFGAKLRPCAQDRMRLDCYVPSTPGTLGVEAVDNDFAIAA